MRRPSIVFNRRHKRTAENLLNKNPDKVGLFFNCNPVLVETFKEVFGNSLNDEGNRVVMVPVDSPLP